MAVQAEVQESVALNEVRIRGRLGADATSRTLPSGSRIVTFRVVVAREQTAMTKGSRQKSDWVDCTVWAGPTRRRAEGWRENDVVEVSGALRRRHYRAGEVAGSRVEVEVLEGRRLERAPVVTRVGGSPGAEEQ